MITNYKLVIGLALCLFGLAACSVGGETRERRGYYDYPRRDYPMPTSLDTLIGGVTDWIGGPAGLPAEALRRAKLGDVAALAQREAIELKRSVHFSALGLDQEYQADPVQQGKPGPCPLIRERIWEAGRISVDRIKEVC